MEVITKQERDKQERNHSSVSVTGAKVSYNLQKKETLNSEEVEDVTAKLRFKQYPNGERRC